MKGLKTIFTERNIGETCRQIREKHGISITDFSRLAGCTRQSVYNFESGKNASLQLYLTYEKLEGDVIE